MAALIDHRLKPLELTQTHWVTFTISISYLQTSRKFNWQKRLDRAAITGPYSGPTGRKRVNFRQTCASDRRAKRIKLTEKADR